MSQGQRPAFRLQLKYENVRYEFGSVWESDRFPGLFDVKLQEGDVEGQYPKMDAKKALTLAFRRTPEGKRVAFIGMASTAPRGERTPSQRSGGDYDRPSGNGTGDDFGGGGFGDDDIPFAPVDERTC